MNENMVKLINTIENTVESHYNGSQGTDNFYLLLAEFCYSQYMKLKKIYSWDWKTISIIGGIMLLAGPV